MDANRLKEIEERLNRATLSEIKSHAPKDLRDLRAYVRELEGQTSESLLKQFVHAKAQFAEVMELNKSLRQELKVCGEAISAVRKGVNQSSLSFDKNLPSEEYGVHMAISRFNLNKITLAEAQPLLSKIMEEK